MNKALSTDDLKRALDGKVSIYTYDQVKEFQTIDQLLGPNERAILLYFWQDEPKYGHWTAVFKTPRGTIEFFDSFGSMEQALKDIPESFKSQHGEDYRYLSKLIYDSPYQCEYNEKKLQADDSSVCGRYVVCRLATMEIPIKVFQFLFNKKPEENDKLVYEITKNI